MKRLCITILMMLCFAVVSQAEVRLLWEAVAIDSTPDTLNFYFAGSSALMYPGQDKGSWSFEIEGLTGSGTLTSVTIEPILSNGEPPSDTSYEQVLWSAQAVTTATNLLELVASVPLCYGFQVIIVETGTGTIAVKLNRRLE